MLFAYSLLILNLIRPFGVLTMFKCQDTSDSGFLRVSKKMVKPEEALTSLNTIAVMKDKTINKINC